jgi:hypothetical protein
MRPAAIVFFYYYLTQTPAADRPRPAPAKARTTRRAHPRSRRAAIPASASTLSNPATGNRTP